MAGITQVQAETNLTAWLNASEALATSKSYTINGRTLTRADTDHALKMVEFWDLKAKELSRGTSINVRQVTPFKSGY